MQPATHYYAEEKFNYLLLISIIKNKNLDYKGRISFESDQQMSVFVGET